MKAIIGDMNVNNMLSLIYHSHDDYWTRVWNHRPQSFRSVMGHHERSLDMPKLHALILAKYRVAWPIVLSRSFPITSRGKVYNLCARSAMLHTSQTYSPSCKSMTRLWSAGCVVSPPSTMSAGKISQRGRSSTIWRRYFTPVDSDGMAVVKVGWRQFRNLIP